MKIYKNLEKPKYNTDNKEANRLMATGVLMVPKALQDALQNDVPRIVSAACINAGVPVDVRKVAQSAPSRETIDRLVENLSVEAMIKINAIIKRNPHVYLQCDKANSDKKGAKSAMFPKLLCIFNPTSEEIVELLLDCDSAGGSSEEAVEGLVLPFERFKWW